MQMPEFIPGLELSKYFFLEAIQPLMAEKFPDLCYSAARLGWGSDVMGFDTPMSMDHGWGPKMTLFLTPEDHATRQVELADFFANHLPLTIRGFPTHFDEPYTDGGVMAAKLTHPIHHMVTITTPEAFFRDYIGVNIAEPHSVEKWLSIPQQKLRTLRAGQVYFDELGQLNNLRISFHWYPHDLWLYLMACQWRRIDQDEPFIGRTGNAGDELGSRLIAARLIRELMRLAFLLAQEYVPYTKWFGSAFQQLPIAAKLTPPFQSILDSQTWKEREAHLSQVYRIMTESHNALKITPKIPLEISNFHGRPFLVPHSSRFVEALQDQIKDPHVKQLPPHLGNVDQISDNTDLLENPEHCQKIIQLFQIA